MLPHARWSCSLAVSVVAAALPAQRALLDKLPADGEAAQFRYVGFGPELTPLELPGDGDVHGFAKIGTRCWIARGKELTCIDWATRKVLVTTPAPKELVGLCADDRFVYGWAGSELHVIDAIAGQSVRTVALASQWSATSITMHRGKVYALVDRAVFAVDIEAGTGEPVLQDRGLLWLASDGERLWGGSATEARVLLQRDGAVSPATMSHEWPWQVRSGAATWVDGRLLVALAHRDTQRHTVITSGLLKVVLQPVARLTLKIQRGEQGMKYELGLSQFAGQEALVRELQRLAQDPASRAQGADGKPMPMPVVLETYSGVTVADVAQAWDQALAAGFPDVSCPQLEGWVRRQHAAPAASGK